VQTRQSDTSGPASTQKRISWLRQDRLERPLANS
jgi:hypothetical protein